MSGAANQLPTRPRRRPRRLAHAPNLRSLDAAASDLTVTGISLDSRKIVSGDLYAALPGANSHGANFAAQAVAAGAVGILTDAVGAPLVAECGVPVVVLEDPRAGLGELSAWVYGNPAESLTIVGITGTNGKTTTSILLEAAWREAGIATGVIGTLAARIGDAEMPSVRTTPEAPELHALLAVMREAGVTHVAMEVSSHGLRLGRVDGVCFALAIFTNLGNDHLDFHLDLLDYYAAKASLFTPDRCRRGLVCVEDSWGQKLAASAAVPIRTYGVSDGVSDVAVDWLAHDVEPLPTGWRFVLSGPGVAAPATVRLPGLFNLSNATAAAAAAIELGADTGAALAGIAASPGAPGRMEVIDEGQPFAVIVDYAHTPDAVSLALDVGRGLVATADNRLIVVLGCGGDRDRSKRPRMGEVAAGKADVVIVTDDNPRSEDPAMIRQAIISGVPEGCGQVDVEEIDDRSRALGRAVAIASAGDVVMALGKGHETGQERGGVIFPFDDRTVLRDALRAAS